MWTDLILREPQDMVALVVQAALARLAWEAGRPRGNPSPEPGEDLVKEFRALPPPLQGGCLKYARELRRKYSPGAGPAWPKQIQDKYNLTKTG